MTELYEHPRASRHIAWRCLLALLLVLSFLLSFFSGILKFWLYDRDRFVHSIADAQYVEELTAYIQDDLKSACTIYGFSYDEISGIVTTEKTAALSEEMLRSLQTALSEGGTPASVSFSKEEFLPAVQSFLSSDEVPDAIRNSQSFAEDWASQFASIVTGDVNAVSYQSVVRPVSAFTSHPYTKMLGDAFYLLAGITLFLLILCLFQLAGKWPKRIYLTAGTLWFASGILLVPTVMLRCYDLPSHLLLTQTPLKIWLDSFINAALSGIYLPSLILWEVSGAAILLSAFWIVRAGAGTVGKSVAQSPQEDASAAQ